MATKGRYSRKGKKGAGILHRAFSEVFSNTPKAVVHTMGVSGPKQAAKQRIAIALSKARQKGVKIPRRSARGK